jgi:predicted RNase H-like HicB family nuclease
MLKYSININFSEEDNCYIATVPAFPGLSAFGDTPEKALEEAKIVLQGFIEVYQEDKRPIPEPDILSPYSGQLRVRMPKDLHAKLSKTAKAKNMSLNNYMIQLLEGQYTLEQVEKFIKDSYEKILLNNFHQQTGSWDTKSNNTATNPISTVILNIKEEDIKRLS